MQFEQRLWRASSFHALGGIKAVDFREGGFGDDVLKGGGGNDHLRNFIFIQANIRNVDEREKYKRYGDRLCQREHTTTCTGNERASTLNKRAV